MLKTLKRYNVFISDPNPLQSGVVNCSNFLTKIKPSPSGIKRETGEHCGGCEGGMKCECVSDGWLSTTTPGNINATQICIDQGYSGDIIEIGNNGGHQCNYPINIDRMSKEKVRQDNFESPVSWQCASGKVYLSI